MDFDLIGGREHGPRGVEALTLVPAAQGQDRLRPVAPAHPAELHALSGEGLARSLDHPGADRQSFVERVGVAHPVLVAAEVGELRRDQRAPWVLLAQMFQRLDPRLGAVVPRRRSVSSSHRCRVSRVPSP